MASKKLTAAWRILTSGRSLEAKMKLIMHVHNFYVYLTNDLEKSSSKAGEVRTLEALRSIVDSQIEETKHVRK